jgi:hypothetical protein
MLLPYYVKLVDNRKIRAACRRAAAKVDEYGDRKLGKTNFDALQDTLAMTAGAAFVGACEGSGVDPHIVVEAILAMPEFPDPPLTKPALVG